MRQSREAPSRLLRFRSTPCHLHSHKLSICFAFFFSGVDFDAMHSLGKTSDRNSDRCNGSAVRQSIRLLNVAHST